MKTRPLIPPPVGTLFSLGDIYITDNAQRILSAAKVINSLARHASCDWGDIDSEDIDSNDRALAYGGQLHSSYGKGDKQFWIITTGDRSKTTVMLPEDYISELYSGEPFPAEATGGRS